MASSSAKAFGALRSAGSSATAATSGSSSGDSGILIRSLYRCLVRRGRWFDARPAAKAVS
jgi:hypothetical protein